MKKYVMSSMVLILVLTACLPSLGGGDEPAVDTVATSVALTQAAQQVAPPAQNPPPQQPAQPTQTLEPDVMATAIVNANCRSGPDVIFDYLATLKLGDSAKVIGMNDTYGDWWQLELNNGTQCWIQADSLTFTGDTKNVAFVTSPATPTPKPKPSWAGGWTSAQMMSANNPNNVEVKTLIIVQNGNTITFSFPAFGNTYNATGVVSDDGLSIDGRAQRANGTDPIRFTFVMVDTNTDQFRGQWYLEGNPSWNGDWCGARNGEIRPTPCRNG
ncbi:MAG: SH3 domain-containing protein [Chloroflexi bacterium]|nr:SH3 domain-containing protein [Chloroflexota bacterium]